MKVKYFILALAALLIVLTGCSAKPGQKTGFGYLQEQFREMDTYVVETTASGEGQLPQKDVVNGPLSEVTGSQPIQQPQGTVVKKVYLTFDDGPDDINTPMLLDVLDSYGVKATFFLIGTNIEKHPGLVREIVKRGHAIGNHTYNHKYDDIYSGNDSFIRSIRINEEIIYQTVGLRPHIIRDPGGKVRNNTMIRQALAQNKYWLSEWNVDSYDSRKPTLTAPQIIENIRGQAQNSKVWSQMVILMHDGKGHNNTVRALPTIIEMLINEGFTFEVLK